MTRSIEGLRQTLEETSAAAPDNQHRVKEVQRRIRRASRRRLAVTAATGLAVVAAGSVAMPQLTASPTDTVTVAGESGPLPRVYHGMGRIAAKQYNAINQKVKLDFTPTGPDTVIIVQCPRGYDTEKSFPDGVRGGGGCWPEDGRLGSMSSSGTDDELLRPGKRVTMEVVVYPSGVWSPKDDNAIERHLATASPKPGKWSVAVYSGTCKDGPVYCAP